LIATKFRPRRRPTSWIIRATILLADTRFADDQHFRVGPGRRADVFPKALNGATLAQQQCVHWRDGRWDGVENREFLASQSDVRFDNFCFGRGQILPGRADQIQP